MTKNEGQLALELMASLGEFVTRQTQLIKELVPAQDPQKVERVPHPEPATYFQFDPISEMKANAKEADFGEELSETELLHAFGEQRDVSPPEKPKPLAMMTREEILRWESEQDNSNDIYKIKARVANLAREGGGTLTGQGEILANSYTHVLKSFYDFAERIEDPTTRIHLVKLIRENEGLPATVIAAAAAGVKDKK